MVMNRFQVVFMSLGPAMVSVRWEMEAPSCSPMVELLGLLL
jgi:hypothetical protein